MAKIFSLLKRAIIGLILVAFTTPSAAETLSERAVYQRCHAKLVRTVPLDEDPFIPKILAGTMTGAEACVQLLNLANFDSTGRIEFTEAQPAQFRLAKSVLASMHDFHNSWFTLKEYVSGVNLCFENMTHSLVDQQSPALFVTRSVFHPNRSQFNFSTIVTATDNPKALREVDNPDRNIFGIEKSVGDFSTYQPGFEFMGNGPLLGVGKWPPLLVKNAKAVVTKLDDVALPLEDVPEFKDFSFDGRKNQGGGILGSQAYLLNNFGEGGIELPNLEKMPRALGKNIFKDFFCRELPVLNPRTEKVAGDADSFVVPTSPLPFRKGYDCVQCHASMDQVLGVVRNQRLMSTGGCGTRGDGYNSRHFFAQPFTSLNKAWAALPSDSYRKNQPYGRLFYRDYRGRLVNIEVNGLAELGAAISKSEDLYVCAAKRYYEYFTGIDVDVAPPTGKLSCDQEFYRNRIIALGLKLKGEGATDFNKNPKKLIESIFALPEFKDRDFGLKRNSMKERVDGVCK